MLFLWSVYGPTGVSEFSLKEAFYAPDDGAFVPQGDTLIVLDDFNTTTGTDRDGYQSCVGLLISAVVQEIKAGQCSVTLRNVGD